MELALLYSGGKDSSLAALVLEDFYDVQCVTGSFGITDDWEYARRAAARLGFAFQTLDLDREIADEAVEMMLQDGYPRNGIQCVHEHAIERLAQLDIDAVADGTRRDDRVPTISRAQAQSLEDRRDIDYITPLSGFGRHAVDQLVKDTFDIEEGPSETIPKADYEGELRQIIADNHDPGTVAEVFPNHTQTYVHGISE